MEYTLKAICLLSKHGFYDGDQFLSEVEYYFDECEKQKIKPIRGMINKTLIEVVKKYLLPIIPFKVECEEYPTMHNPIRLVKIDDNEIKDYKLIYSLLEGVEINVNSNQIKEIIEKIHNEYI